MECIGLNCYESIAQGLVNIQAPFKPQKPFHISNEKTFALAEVWSTQYGSLAGLSSALSLREQHETSVSFLMRQHLTGGLRETDWTFLVLG